MSKLQEFCTRKWIWKNAYWNKTTHSQIGGWRTETRTTHQMITATVKTAAISFLVTGWLFLISEIRQANQLIKIFTFEKLKQFKPNKMNKIVPQKNKLLGKVLLIGQLTCSANSKIPAMLRVYICTQAWKKPPHKSKECYHTHCFFIQTDYDKHSV